MHIVDYHPILDCHASLHVFRRWYMYAFLYIIGTFMTVRRLDVESDNFNSQKHDVAVNGDSVVDSI